MGPDTANCSISSIGPAKFSGAALGWLEETGDGASMLRIAAALGGLWHFRSHRLEERRWSVARALPLGGNAVPAARHRAGEAHHSGTRSGLEPNPALAMEAVDIRRALGDFRGVGRALYLCSTLVPSGDIDRKLELLTESEDYARRGDNACGLGWIYYDRAMVRLQAGDVEGALDLMRDVLAFFRTDGFHFGISNALIVLAELESQRGNHLRSAQHYAEILELWSETNSKELLFKTISRVATLVHIGGNPEEAATLLAAIDTLSGSADFSANPMELDLAAREKHSVYAQLSPTRFEVAWEAGRRLTIDGAISRSNTALNALGTPVLPTKQAAATGLTPREREVIQLLAAGKSNREIAQTLCISENTAISHVRSILPSLDSTHVPRQPDGRSGMAWTQRHPIERDRFPHEFISPKIGRRFKQRRVSNPHS